MERDMQLLNVYRTTGGSSIWLTYLNNTYCSWLKNKNYLDSFVVEGAVHKLTRKV